MKLISKIFVFQIICSALLSAQPAKALTGIDVLKRDNFNVLAGKKIGLITNPTGVDNNLNSTIDILFNADNVELAALFGPEHGVRGNFSAGEKVRFYYDEQTGLPVYSLYGKNRKPKPEWLKGLDALTFDIQDIGSRSYTYISTMGLAMEAAAENDLEFIVLDRPNPLGGKRIEGCITEKGFESFVSQFPIPYIHGLTVGELALYLNNEVLPRTGKKCRLKVVKMEGWRRDMYFKDTGLKWVPTSPHIPEPDSPFFYAATGIVGELNSLSIGVGYTIPFKTLAIDSANSSLLASEMNKLKLEGVLFRPISYKPFYAFGNGKEMHGVQIYITDYDKVKLMQLQFYFLEITHKLYPNFNPFQNTNRLTMFDKVVGTDRVRKLFSKNYNASEIAEIFNEDADDFRRISGKYYLYK